MTHRFILLYEDSRVAGKQFGPHELMLASVRDLTGCQDLDLDRRVRGLAKNGNSKVVAGLRPLDRVAPSGEQVVAVLDDDRVRRLLALDADACKRVVVSAIRGRCDDPTRLQVVLLERHIEDVLRALRSAADALRVASIDRAALGRAIEKGRNNRLDRDIVMIQAARADAAPIRAHMRQNMPSFGRLCEVVARGVRTPTTAKADSAPG